MTHPSVISWQNPPASGLGRERVSWEHVLHELRGNPGQYALIGQYPGRTTAATWAQSLKNKYPGYKFKSAAGAEVRTRGHASELYGMFAGAHIEARAA